MPYNKTILDLGTDPKNAGTMNKDDPEVGYGLVGAPACGDVIALYIKIKNNKVIDAKFQAFGCTSAIASIEFLTRELKNKSISEAKTITNKQIYNQLKLPPIKYHCSVLAEEAVNKALNHFFDKQKNL